MYCLTVNSGELEKGFNYLMKDFLAFTLIFWSCLKIFSFEEVRQNAVAISQSTR